MNDDISLTLALGGWLYMGCIAQWRDYAHALTAGKTSKYKSSAAFHNQSLTEFFRLFRHLWDSKKSTQPNPEDFGLTPLRPAFLTQNQLIDALIDEAA